MNESAATVVSSSVAFDGRIFTVTTDRVTMPNGRTVTLDIVRHAGSVVLLPIHDDGRIVLIRQYRYAIGRWIWELPAGSLEEDEDPATAAARECEEETGLVPARVELAGSWYPTPGFCNEVMHYYRLTGLHEPDPEGPRAVQDEDEDIRVRAVSPAEARDLLGRGEIVDLKTAWGLTMVGVSGGR
jgi:ADP-ribose pyrophosphatase